jgi:hypothetical protein
MVALGAYALPVGRYQRGVQSRFMQSPAHYGRGEMANSTTPITKAHCAGSNAIVKQLFETFFRAIRTRFFDESY